MARQRRFADHEIVAVEMRSRTRYISGWGVVIGYSPRYYDVRMLYPQGLRNLIVMCRVDELCKCGREAFERELDVIEAAGKRKHRAKLVEGLRFAERYYGGACTRQYKRTIANWLVTYLQLNYQPCKQIPTTVPHRIVR